MSELQIVESGLVPVYQGETGDRLVDARELHEFLQSGWKFTEWMKDRLHKYGFAEGQDFFRETRKTPTGGRPSENFWLTIDTAKEIAMVENNAQGQQVRRYFIEVERRAKQLPAQSPAHVALAMAQALVEHERRLSVMESRVLAIEESRQAAEAELAALPEPTGPVADITTRALLNRLIRSYCTETGLDHKAAWNGLYMEFRDRYHIDLKARATKSKGPLDVADNLGHVQTLYNLAQLLFRKAS